MTLVTSVAAAVRRGIGGVIVFSRMKRLTRFSMSNVRVPFAFMVLVFLWLWLLFVVCRFRFDAWIDLSDLAGFAVGAETATWRSWSFRTPHILPGGCGHF